ncbi:MAG: peptidoglycan DD-metalloendopeptidase family protein [Ferruginibacter sp.]|nr:peptidoglycan DD-metalloendopeptidase family protein [Ferruginibacter sp.]
MKKVILFIATLFFASLFTYAQQTREELEKQKLQLKKELKETEKMLSDNKAKTKENFLQWKLISDKVNIQDRIVENINSDINLLDRSLTATQRDINRFDRLLDTLKQEYAKSMVYAYKNRSNYDFLNFIFSASNFNDAIKRIAYLKSYRNYREMQGQNIIRTQELRRQRVEELTGTKQKKTIVLQSKDQELSVLEKEQKEKDRILAELKKQGKNLSAQYAAKAAKMRKVEGAMEAMRLKAIADAKAKILAEKKATEKAERDRLAAIKKNNPTTTNPTTSPVVKKVDKPIKVTKPVKEIEPTIVTDENRATNESFVKNKGSLPWPVTGRVLFHYGRNEMPGTGAVAEYKCVTIATEIGASVKAIFSGEVTAVMEDDGGTVMIQHGGFFTSYTNLSNVTVRKGQQVTLGQMLGKAMANMDGVGTTDLYLFDERARYYDPQIWLRH